VRNADPADVAAVSRQLGPIKGAIAGEPDIVINFVDRLPDNGRLRYLGVNDCGFTDDAFLVLRSKHKSRAKVQIPFEAIGGTCEIVCERGVPAVPLLIAIVNLTALAKGVLPLHASAFLYEGKGMLATGWAKGGKTETLLAFMDQGATYVGDEWVYISPDGKRMFGIPEPIRVWDWHLDDLPTYWGQLSSRDRLRLRALRVVADSMEVASGKGPTGRLPGNLLRRMHPLVSRQLYVHMPPRKTFGENSFALEGPLHKLFFVASHEPDEITVRPEDPERVARRMVFSLEEERAVLLSTYWKFRFAFPDRKNQLIEDTEQIQRNLLLQMMKEKEVYSVYHPYPVAIPALYEAMAPYAR
jgi:hypothetical protein